MEEARCLAILAAGDFPNFRLLRQALCEAFFVICCDSAYRAFCRSEFRDKDFVVVGDGDSLPAEERKALGEKYILNPDQETNDLTKAIHYAATRFPQGVRVILGNISLLAWYREHYPQLDIEMLTDYGRFVALQGSRTFESFPRQQVSIFSLTPHIAVSSEGLRWPLGGRCLEQWWQGTLNEAVGDRFSVSGGSLIVFQTYEPKL